MLKKILFVVVFSVVTLITFLLCFSAEAYNLPDSGQTQCFSNKGKIKIVPCPPPGDLGAQDGSYSINLPSFTINADDTVLPCSLYQAQAVL